MLQGKFCFPKLSWVALHYPIAVHYLFICWSRAYNYSSSLTENAPLIQCCDSEYGMKNGFQPLQELAVASQEYRRNPEWLRGSQLVSRISYLGYSPTHVSDGNSRQCQLGGNLVPRPIVCCCGFFVDAGIAACGGGGTHRSNACADKIAQSFFSVPVLPSLCCLSALKILFSYKNQ